MNIVDKILDLVETLIAPLRRANWRIIFLSLSTATIFWFFNALNKEYTARINYPVEIVYSRDSLVSVKDLPKNIPVNVTGGGWQMLKKTLSANVDPIKITPKNPVQTLYLTGANLLPAFSEQLDGLNVNYVAIDTLYFKIEQIIERRLTIVVDSLSIDLRENFALDSEISIDPDTILFTGPSSLINELPSRFIITLSESDVNKNYDEELSMDLFSASNISKEPEVILVKFDVVEYEERVEELAIEPVNFPYDSSVFISKPTIRAKCRIKKDREITPDNLNFVIIADLNNVDPKDSTVFLEVIRRDPDDKTGALGLISDIELENDRVKVDYDQEG